MCYGPLISMATNNRSLFTFSLILMTSCSTPNFVYKAVNESDLNQKGKFGYAFFLDQKKDQGFIDIDALGYNSNEKAMIIRLTLEHFDSKPILIDPNEQRIEFKTERGSKRIISESAFFDEIPIKIPPKFTQVVDLAFKLDPKCDSVNHLKSFTAEINLNRGSKKFQKSVEFKRTQISKTRDTSHSLCVPNRATLKDDREGPPTAPCHYLNTHPSTPFSRTHPRPEPGLFSEPCSGNSCPGYY